MKIDGEKEYDVIDMRKTTTHEECFPIANELNLLYIDLKKWYFNSLFCFPRLFPKTFEKNWKRAICF